MTKTEKRKVQHSEQLNGHESEVPALLRGLLVAALLSAVAAAYANSFDGVMLFDDYYIIQNEARLDPIDCKAVLASPRPVVDFSLALNHAAGGLEPWGYHLVNLVIHLLATLTLYGLVRRSLCAPALKGRFTPGEAAGIGFAVALLWGLHPLQTQSVTYIIQRAESMMGLFYMLMLYAIARANEPTATMQDGGPAKHRPIGWFFVAVVSCALGMLTKQVMVTAPLAALLYDRALWQTSWRDACAKHGLLYVGLLSTWAILLLTGVVQGVLEVSPEAGSTVGFGLPTITWQQYALTQPAVLLHYLRLVLWPHPLCMDHDWPIVVRWQDAALHGVIIVTLLTACLWAWRRRSAPAFAGLMFFLLLAPTSSFIPIRDVIFEHRMYLPLAAVLVLLVIGGYRLLQRCFRQIGPRNRPTGAAAALLIAVAIMLGTMTHLRNRDYHSRLDMWTSVLAIYPDHPRAHNNLAVALSEVHRYEESVRHFSRAIELEPTFLPAYTSIAQDLVRLGRSEEAEPYYRKAAELQPNDWSAAYNHGSVLFDLRRYQESELALRNARSIDPGELPACIMLSNALSQQSRHAEALEELRSGLDAARPGTPDDVFAKARFNLANTLARLSRYADATEEYREAIRLNPAHYEARYGLGYALRQMGMIEAAREAYEAALAIRPDYAPARAALDALGTSTHQPVGNPPGKDGQVD